VRTVAVDILTGFLGSGKTTLLRHVLEHGLHGKRIAIVMNEIGEVGIDGRVVTGLSAVEKMVELSSGCICCTIDDYRFDVAIQEIVDTAQPHLIIIESTGLADPEPLLYRARAAGLGLDAVITVVDAADVDRHLAEATVTRLQIEAADFLVISKSDLVSRRRLARVQRRLRRLNPRADLRTAVGGAVDGDVLFATGVATYRERLRETSGHLDSDGIGSFVYRTERLLDRRRFEQVLAGLDRDVLRAKGVVRLAGSDRPAMFSVTCGRYEIETMPTPMAIESQAVFIGRNLERHEPRLRRRLVACEVEAPARGAGLHA